MGLKLMKSNGKVRKIWYGQYKERGKWKITRLTTPMRGAKIPSKLSEPGDEAFERSKIRAQAEFDAFEQERKQKGCSEHIAQLLIESKTGQKFENVRVSDLEAKWRITHNRNRTERWDNAISWIFSTFTKSAQCEYIIEVTPEIVSAYYESIRKNYAWSVVQRMMRLISSAFATSLPVGSVNPFSKVKVSADKQTQGTIHRKPLSENELAALFQEARKDPLQYSLTITAACTGMRIGDVCKLEWKSVDLKNGLIDVKTQKTGQEVTVPIFPKLKAVLEDAWDKHDSRDKYVFDRAAQMYDGNYTSVITMGKMLFARALCMGKGHKEVAEADPNQKVLSAEEVINKIRSAGFSDKKEPKVEKAYTLYKSGMTYREIERETGFSRGQISGYLHELEELTGNQIIKDAKASPFSKKSLLEKTRQKRKIGRHAASIYGWHSLRASFVVQAIMSNIPIEIVRRIVGHSNTNMTLEYFNPTKRIIADTIRKGMKDSVLAKDDLPVLS